ncbi:DUF368 domain-containing protein [Carnobacterium funditum]|uniref:DUF368 domain-containing protein n=1 Tax=Carnobacterium funditum TaxID=2752 RepID=UPI00054D7A11|nr:DUF368 domain-containing protein [Carnobacterium funditum]
MNYLIDILKGMVIGISNIIPGVSGGTMAVSLGIYDRMIFSISQLFKNWKVSLKILMPILIGAGFGVVAFTYTIEFLLSNYTLPTALAFVGMILGGVPVLWVSFQAGLKMKNEKLNIGHLIIFMLMFAIVAFLPMFQGAESSFEVITITPFNMIKLFLIGIIASATMIIPGMSGSLVLMILGYYYSIINTITSFIDALRAGDMAIILPNFIVLAVFGIGVLIGIFLISKIIEYLFKHYSSATYSGILGLVLASPFAIMYNTNALSDLTTAKGLPFAIIGLILMVLCFMGIYQLGRKKIH